MVMTEKKLMSRTRSILSQSSKDTKQGDTVPWEPVDKWRAGKAGDTVAVVIISRLPVVCLMRRHLYAHA